MARILVVDDEEPIRYALRLALQASGHDVDEAEDGKRALKALAGHDYDLVIADILMPEKDGIEMILDLKKIRPSLPVIAISGGGQMGARTYLEMAGDFHAEATLGKPIRPRDLMETVERLLAPRP
ncbi:MAG: response regulator [Magnetospirillum sp. WYHS-4]